jgi:hypothetical protein
MQKPRFGIGKALQCAIFSNGILFWLKMSHLLKGRNDLSHNMTSRAKFQPFVTRPVYCPTLLWKVAQSQKALDLDIQYSESIDCPKYFFLENKN